MVRPLGREPRLRHRRRRAGARRLRACADHPSVRAAVELARRACRTRTAASARTCARTATPRWRGRGASTASQTAWALLACDAAGDRRAPPSSARSRWLVETQRPRRRLGRAVLHRHRLPRRLLPQLPPVPGRLPGDGARPRSSETRDDATLLVLAPLRVEQALLRAPGRLDGAAHRDGARRARAIAAARALAIDARAVAVAGVCAGGRRPTLARRRRRLRDRAAPRRTATRSTVPGSALRRGGAPPARPARPRRPAALGRPPRRAAPSGARSPATARSPSTWSRPGSPTAPAAGRSPSCASSPTRPAARLVDPRMLVDGLARARARSGSVSDGARRVGREHERRRRAGARRCRRSRQTADAR